jgi:hypothetical protein
MAKRAAAHYLALEHREVGEIDSTRSRARELCSLRNTVSTVHMVQILDLASTSAPFHRRICFVEPVVG